MKESKNLEIRKLAGRHLRLFADRMYQDVRGRHLSAECPSLSF